MAIPVTPTVAERSATFNTTPIQTVAAPVQLTSGVTMTTPSSATLITGLTQQVNQIPSIATMIRVTLQGKSATVTAGATITLGCYTGVTTGALTTLQGTQVYVAPTGGTGILVNATWYIPTTSTLIGTSPFFSIAVTASTGNYVLNAGATEPCNFVVEYL